MINHILSAYKYALEAVKPEHLVRAAVSLSKNTLTICNRSFDLDIIRNIYVVGAGKAVLGMAKPVFDLLKTRIHDAALAAVEFDSDYSELSKYVHLASHPVPDKKSVKAALKILDIANKAQENDLVIVLISGGASSLMALPEQNISLLEKQLITNNLLKSGVSIEEINRQRKQLSAIKGGKLALAAFPANVISVIISDVKDDDISVIGSGPTVCHDENDALKFVNVTNHIVGNNKTALSAAACYL
ncbi:MAG: glycerate-2-kinase family protein, partial [Candidatus Riflebacteria bacterium]|nr:glycerate-2-kinase family protein [Candidatus Riflebacteria bacterium]